MIELNELTSLSDPSWDAFLDVLEQTFPPEELETREDIREQVAGGHGHRCWWIETGNEKAGVLRALRFPEGSFGWVVHLALLPSARGLGLGHHVFERLAELFKSEDPAFTGFLLEVERIEDATDEPDAQARSKRLEFFSRLGAVRVSRSYVQPPTRPETSPVMLNLLWLGDPEVQHVTLVEAFYQLGFGVHRDHHWVKQTLAGIAEPN